MRMPRYIRVSGNKDFVITAEPTEVGQVRKRFFLSATDLFECGESDLGPLPLYSNSATSCLVSFDLPLHNQEKQIKCLRFYKVGRRRFVRCEEWSSSEIIKRFGNYLFWIVLPNDWDPVIGDELDAETLVSYVAFDGGNHKSIIAAELDLEA